MTKTCDTCKETFTERWSLSLNDRETDLPKYFCGTICMEEWRKKTSQKYGVQNNGSIASHRKKYDPRRY